MLILRVVLLLYFLFLPIKIFAASVVINEIAWMGSLPKSGETATQASNNEWIELKNETNTLIDIQGWTLSAEDGTPNILLSGIIDALGFFILERTSDDTVLGVTADQIYTGALSNSGEYLILKDSAGTIKDEVNASSGWPAGDNVTKYTMQLVGSDWVTALPTPRKSNQEALSSTSTPAASNFSSAAAPETSFAPQDQSSNQNFKVFVPPNIKVYAGEDATLSVGSIGEFSGAALGIKNEPLENARYLWNFGDGETKEGKIVEHVYRIPGKYTVGLHVSSGEYAVSDYLVANVISNQVSISGVLIGGGGFIKLINPANENIDIGGWIFEDALHNRFVVPAKTKIGAKSEIAFANITTGLLKSGPTKPVKVMYPNLSFAFEWNKDFSENQKTSEAVVRSGNTSVRIAAAIENKDENMVDRSGSDEKAASATKKDEFAKISETNPKPSNIFFGMAIILSFAAAAGFWAIRKIIF